MKNIEQVQEFFNFILTNGTSGIIIAIVAVLFYIIKEPVKFLDNFIKIHKLLNNSQKQKNKLEKEVKESYLEELNRIYFEILHGISTNKNNRIILNNLIKEYNESIEWNDLKLAYSYFKFSQNGLSVAIDTTDKIWFGFWHFLNYIFFGYLLFFDLTLIFYLPSINAPSFEELLKLVLLLLSTVVIVNLFFTWLIINIDSLNTPYQRAIKIKKIINNNQ